MNAYELAKYIEDDIQIQEGIADMLRQQADRIAELENVVSFWKNMYQNLNDILGKYKTLNPPHKELSDEEITKLHLKCWDEIEFARAIIKASKGEE